MYKYLFITYGEPGWRGVQVRALRIAEYLPKKEVLFWNCYDSDFITSYGFDTVVKDSGIVDPKDIVFPKGVEIVVFADLPTNEFFTYAVYQAALQQKKKIVICEQLYRRGQLQESVFATFQENSDLFLVNALSFFTTEETENIKVVPPQIEYKISDGLSDQIRQNHAIPNDAFLLLGIGYNDTVFAKIETIATTLSKEFPKLYTIILGEKGRQKQVHDRLITLPFAEGEEYVGLLAAADVVLVKFGFLQILEALALHKPTIVLGEGGYILRTPEVLDVAYQDVLRFDQEVTEETYTYLRGLIANEAKREALVGKLQQIHNGALFGGKVAAGHIEALLNKPLRKKPTHAKKLAILVNNEVFDKAAWLGAQKDVYPLCFTVAMPAEKQAVKRIPEEVLQQLLGTLEISREEILPHTFKQHVFFSKRKVDGLVDIFPWYGEWIAQLEQLIQAADVIFITKNGKILLNDFIKEKKCLEKVEMIP